METAARKTSQVLDAPVPGHWGSLQRVKNGLIYVAVRAVVCLLAAAPYALARLFGTLVGHLAASLPLPEQRRARRQLGQAFPDWRPPQVHRVARRMFVHLAHSAVDLIHLERFTTGKQAVLLSEEQRAVLDTTLALGKGAVAVSGHIGNWELLAQVLASGGYPISSIAKPLYDPRLTRWVHRVRSSRGQQVIWRGDGSASKEMIRAFRKGRALALLIDQDTKVQGSFVPFFGRPAYTPTAAASLALRLAVPIIVGWLHRTPEGYQAHIERLEPDGDDDVDSLTAKLTLRLEHAIRLAPEQWVWLHARWQRQPGFDK